MMAADTATVMMVAWLTDTPPMVKVLANRV